MYQSLHDIVNCAPPPFPRPCFFLSGSFFSELVLVLRQILVSCDWCCAANGDDNGAANGVASFLAADADTAFGE